MEREGLSMKAKRMMSYLTVIILTVAVVIGVEFVLTREPEPAVSNDILYTKIENVGELVTSKMTYRGIVKYTEGKVPLITKKSFLMVYTAYIDAGVDMTEATVEEKSDRIVVTLPEVELFRNEVDPDSIEYYDENYGILTRETKDDALNSMSAAKQDVIDNAGIDYLKEQAATQAKILMQGLLGDELNGKIVVVN